jgi:hypothetical protein
VLPNRPLDQAVTPGVAPFDRGGDDLLHDAVLLELFHRGPRDPLARREQREAKVRRERHRHALEREPERGTRREIGTAN